VLGLYLQQLGLSAFQVGLVLTAAVAGSALMNVSWALLADRFGRRRTVATMALLMIVGGLLFTFTDRLDLLILGALTGTVSASSSEVGPFVTVEQAILPQTAPAERRTWLFSIYDALGMLAGAAGALFTSVVGLFARMGLAGADAYRPLFVLYAAMGLANLVLFLGLSPGVESARIDGAQRFVGLHRSRGIVAGLSALFGLDALAGGFVLQSIVAYWFHIRWGLSPAALGVLFFWVGVLSGVSARRRQAGPAVRAAEHDGVHPRSLERAADAGAAGTGRVARRSPLPRADERVADGRTYAQVLHHGSRRPR
jgi:MFS family permease